MRYNRFHISTGPVLLHQLAEHLGVAFIGDAQLELQGIASLKDADKTQISFLDNSKYVADCAVTNAGAVILKEAHVSDLPKGCAALISDNPYYTYAQALHLFYPQKYEVTGISAAAHVDSTAQLAADVTVESGAVVGARVTVGKGSYIASGAVIGADVMIGENCVISPNATVVCTEMGHNVKVYSGCSIGQDGFGFAPSKGGILKVPHVGKVVIEDAVEIGAGSTIDRGSLSNTEIGAGTKIDNLVQIGHNVKIGKNCMIVSQVGIAGSTTLGDGVVVGGQSGFVGHITVADGVNVAARSAVTKSITEKGIVVAGFPAIPMKEWRREQAVISRLAKKDGGKK